MSTPAKRLSLSAKRASWPTIQQAKHKDETSVERALHAVDSVLNLLVFMPSMAFFWRGIWDLYGVYIFPGQEPLTHWATFAFGSCSIFGYMLLPVCKWAFSMVSRWPREILTRIYLIGYSILYMAYWRGVWSVADYYLFPYDWEAGAIGMAICYPTLLILKGSKSTLFPPYVTALDTRGDVLEAGTRFLIKVQRTVLLLLMNCNQCTETEYSPKWSQPSSILLYFLDSAFTHFVISTLVILLWRSMWAIVKQLFSSMDDHTSDWICFGIGYPSVAILFACEEPIAMLCVYLEKRGWHFAKLVWENAVFAVATCTLVFIWRGTWHLNVYYIISDPFLGGWVNLGIGTVLLVSLQLVSFVGFCGCSVDGTTPGRDGIFPTQYLRVYLMPKIIKIRTKAVEDATGEGLPGMIKSDSTKHIMKFDEIAEERDQSNNLDKGIENRAFEESLSKY
ncbi:hypothetical protein CAPTEDRAFT_198494 [Capitella teleta]|uniref:Uncharacterized protein n=1 Tax=Capitella teleta TaxID=283909 RepID=R7UE70_CAPTE|nr:hypothetical protein CAPTEDRAFT_198494 [Capitella teleta]|eukprot:ELU04834.1 hypothetical protein CAPTEDRAFT_198494 [Capitella teleta]